MAGVRIVFGAGDAPMSGQDYVDVTTPATLSALKTAAGTALASNGGLMDAVKKADVNGNAPALVIQVNRMIMAQAI